MIDLCEQRSAEVNAPPAGHNASIIGYGGCGAGKTHTVTGPGLLLAMNEEDFGVLPRAVRQLYAAIQVGRGYRPGYF